MENFVSSFNVVAPLFILMAIGYVLKKIKFLSEEFLNQLNQFVFNFCFPIMLFQDIKLYYKENVPDARLFYITICGIIFIIFFSVLVVPFFIKEKTQRGSIIQGIYRSNALVYGSPIITKMYGNTAIGKISVLMCIIIPLYNIAAIIILTIHSDRKKTYKNIIQNIIKNPLIIGSIIGFLVGTTKLKLPNAIETTIEQLSKLAIPLALFIMGGDFKIKNFQNNFIKIAAVTIIRLIIIPVIIIIISIYLGLRDINLAIVLSIFATPTAMASYLMAKNMKNDYDLAGQIVVLTTACSCITIFLLIYFLYTYGYIKPI